MYGERKLTWTEVVDLLKSISEQEERNCERAIVDEGPYKIRDTFTPKLQIPFSAHIGQSHAKKAKINKKVHELSMEAALQQRRRPTNPTKKQGKKID